MAKFKNAMEIFKLLEKSNCRKCNETTCLAFASKVFLGRKALADCPVLSPDVLARYRGGKKGQAPGESDQADLLESMKQPLKTLDLEQAAARTGGTFAKGRLTLKIFGKPFAMDNSGRFITDIHVNPWIAGPILTYVLESSGLPVKGDWVPFRELKDGRELNGLFLKRAEIPMKKIADAYPGLFEDLILIFSGRRIEERFESDISLVLYPLPLVPVLICYWKPEEGMASDLHLFFDASASQNGGSDMVFRLTAGLVRMFEKLSETHGWKDD